ncbi:MAG TPA: copper resistance CopC family protein [Caldimonas sp.]|jgi:methionine-rich copper-binding protein CopC|nr:copper resistance CopC family protein [Caldimonas sp.]
MKLLARAGSLVLGLALSTAVLAHAMLDHAVPPVGGSVGVAPGRVELWFSEPLEAAFSTLRVVDANGRQVDRRDVAVDKKDRKHLTASLAPVPPGRYRVVWRVVSVDTHATEGDFVFDVSP